MADFDLLQKTELIIKPVSLYAANLNDIADTVSEVLCLNREDVLVIDAINGILAIDLLCDTVDPYAIVGNKDALLQRLAEIPNVGISEETDISSHGMLGWIADDRESAIKSLRNAEKIYEEFNDRMSRRVIVFSTGEEVLSGQIEDTNQPTIAAALEAEDLIVTRGGTLIDDRDFIAMKIRAAISEFGFSAVVTTGGVGAEKKDQSVEALEMIDADAAMPYICRLEKGHGRHFKDGIRIGVGKKGDTTIVVLPGPNDEVKAALPTVVSGLKAGVDKQVLAENIAAVLRKKLRSKIRNGHSHKAPFVEKGVKDFENQRKL